MCLGRLKFAVFKGWLLSLLTLAGLTWLVLRGAERLGYSWHRRQIPRYFGTMTEAGFIAGPMGGLLPSGLSRMQSYRIVILPQALRQVL